MKSPFFSLFDIVVVTFSLAEYARVYLRAKKAKGCNGLGEIENLLDEFRKMVYEVMRYCSTKKYIDDLAIYTIDVTDEELEKLSKYLETSYEQ